jgi:hypothetical protein
MKKLVASAPPDAPWVKSTGRLSNNEKVLQGLKEQYAALQPPMNEQESAMARLMKQPKIRDALNDAKQLGEIGLDTEPPAQPSFSKMFNYMKKIKDLSGAAYTKGMGDLGGRLKDVATAIDEHLQDNVEGYHEVSAEYARRMKLERAYEFGHEMFSGKDSRNIASTMANMSVDETRNARLAMASDLITNLRSDAATTQINKLQNVSRFGVEDRALQDKIKAMFGDQKTFEQFMQFAKAEHTMSTMQSAYGGSATARRLAATGDVSPAELLTKASTSGHGNLYAIASRALGHAGLNAVRRAQADALATPLMTKGALHISSVIDELLKSPSAISSIATQGVPAALSGLLTRKQ